MKICTKCKIEKSELKFNTDKSKKDCLQCWCKGCWKTFRKTNKEKIASEQKRYREKHREKLIKYYKEWRVKNPDYTVKYYELNKEKIKEKTKIWRKKNPEKVFGHNTTRRSSLCSFDKKSWIKIMSKNNWKCFYCDMSLNTTNRTIDHIIALNCGGTNNIDNCIASCISCNCSKKDTLVINWHKFKFLSSNKQQYLLEILERYNES